MRIIRKVLFSVFALMLLTTSSNEFLLNAQSGDVSINNEDSIQNTEKIEEVTETTTDIEKEENSEIVELAEEQIEEKTSAEKSDENDIARITVNYRSNESGYLDVESLTFKHGEPYNIEPKEIEGWTFLKVKEDSDPTSGIADKDRINSTQVVITFLYFYSGDDFRIEVDYHINDEDNTHFYKDVFNLKRNEAYKYEPKAFEHMTFLNANESKYYAKLEGVADFKGPLMTMRLTYDIEDDYVILTVLNQFTNVYPVIKPPNENRGYITFEEDVLVSKIGEQYSYTPKEYPNAKFLYNNNERFDAYTHVPLSGIATENQKMALKYKDLSSGFDYIHLTNRYDGKTTEIYHYKEYANVAENGDLQLIFDAFPYEFLAHYSEGTKITLIDSEGKEWEFIVPEDEMIVVPAGELPEGTYDAIAQVPGALPSKVVQVEIPHTGPIVPEPEETFEIDVYSYFSDENGESITSLRGESFTVKKGENYAYTPVEYDNISLSGVTDYSLPISGKADTAETLYLEYVVDKEYVLFSVKNQRITDVPTVKDFVTFGDEILTAKKGEPYSIIPKEFPNMKYLYNASERFNNPVPTYLTGVADTHKHFLLKYKDLTATMDYQKHFMFNDGQTYPANLGEPSRSIGVSENGELLMEIDVTRKGGAVHLPEHATIKLVNAEGKEWTFVVPEDELVVVAPGEVPGGTYDIILQVPGGTPSDPEKVEIPDTSIEVPVPEEDEVTLTVKHLVNDKEVAQTETKILKVGQSYETQAVNEDWINLVAIPANASGVAGKTDIVVEYQYKLQENIVSIDKKAVAYDLNKLITEQEFLDNLNIVLADGYQLRSNFNEVYNAKQPGKVIVTIWVVKVLDFVPTTRVLTANEFLVDELAIDAYIGVQPPAGVDFIDLRDKGTDEEDTDNNEETDNNEKTDNNKVDNKKDSNKLPTTGELTNEMTILGGVILSLGLLIMNLRKFIR